jgi:hypothetical protein
VHAPLSDPGGINVSGPLDTSMLPSAVSDGVGSHEETLSRLHPAACTLPVYASRRRLPTARATLGSGCGPALPGGIAYPLGSFRRFPPFGSACSTWLPPSPGFAWRTAPTSRRAFRPGGPYVRRALLDDTRIATDLLKINCSAATSVELDNSSGIFSAPVPTLGDGERRRCFFVSFAVGAAGEGR